MMSDQFPFFSVIINTHNSEQTINSTLKSIFNQKFKDFEIILVDDNSTDRTVSMVSRQKKSSIYPFKIIRLKNNMGISYSRNLGIKLSKGRYISFIDGDDVWKKNKLDKEHNVILTKKFDWVFSNYEVINENYQYLYSRFRQPGEYFYNNFVNNGNPVGLLTVTIASKILQENKFREIKHEDYDLWIRLAQQGYKGYLIKESLAQYMVHKNSLSSNKVKAALWTYLVFRKNKIGVLKSCCFMFNYIRNAVQRNR